jgi:hypothetical protein
MSLDLNEGTQVDTIWFVSWGWGDLCAYVFKQPDDVWKAEYRFRHYKEEDPFNNKDIENWQGYRCTQRDQTPEALVGAMSLVARMTVQQYGGTLYELVIKGNGLKALAELQKQSWAHSNKVLLN